jgi:hypothetical protein
MTIKSLDFYAGYRLVEAAKSAAEKLGMKFEEFRDITDRRADGTLVTKSHYIISGKNEEYKILDDDENEDGQFGGFYRNIYSLYKDGNLAADTLDYARWNKFDETVEVKHFTELYVKDDFTKAIFDILEGK